LCHDSAKFWANQGGKLHEETLHLLERCKNLRWLRIFVALSILLRGINSRFDELNPPFQNKKSGKRKCKGAEQE
jgi:hypothetical protein